MGSERFNEQCPECGATLRFNAQDVVKQRTVRCTRGHSVDLVDESHRMRDVERQLRKIDKDFRF